MKKAALNQHLISSRTCLPSRPLWALLVMFAAMPLAHATSFRLKLKLLHGHLSERNAFDGFGCHGANRSPALSWTGVPPGTRSLVLTVFDENAAHLTQSGWWHWVLVNIPATQRGLPSGAGDQKAGVGQEVLTDFGRPGYGGPCPPHGDGVHHYLFTLYALKQAQLSVGPGTTGAAVTFMARHAALAEAQAVATFKR